MTFASNYLYINEILNYINDTLIYSKKYNVVLFLFLYS
ncbi:hypothetical protein SAMN05421692_0954 [Chryseobacterium indologenes]|nr:hypothetical protein SAMN05421692_0954 [Chryseobacterium indologenes]SUX49846.1 Uncharacterised protein [Chryseobacterium indologenes]